MLRMLQDRICRVLMMSGLVFFMLTYVFLTEDHFVMHYGGNESVITRKGNPLIYWGAESADFLIAFSFFATAIYRGRRLKKDSEKTAKEDQPVLKR